MRTALPDQLPASTTAALRAGPDDEWLVERAQRDRHAFAPLYERYADPVYRYCHRRLGDATAAEDATSLVFAKALAALPRYRGGSFRGWLFTIAHHTVVDGLRARCREAPLDLAVEPVDPDDGPEEAFVEAEAGREARLLLRALTPSQRQVVELWLAGLSDDEIAAVTGRSTAATRMHRWRAAERLRDAAARDERHGGLR